VIFNISLTKPLTGRTPINFTITTNDATEGQVWSQGQPAAPAISAQTINFTITGPQAAGLTFPVRVYGRRRPGRGRGPAVHGDHHVYELATGSVQRVHDPGDQLRERRHDVPGVVVSRTSGLITTESGGTDTVQREDWRRRRRRGCS